MASRDGDFHPSSCAPVAHGKQINNLPRAASRKRRAISLGSLRPVSDRPITNRPQVANLPHKKIFAACEEEDELVQDY
jgi:hypothetical protein